MPGGPDIEQCPGLGVVDDALPLGVGGDADGHAGRDRSVPRSMAGSVLVASRSPASSLTWIWAQAGTRGGVPVWPVTGSMVVAPLR